MDQQVGRSEGAANPSLPGPAILAALRSATRMKTRAMAYALVTGLGLIAVGSSAYLFSEAWQRLQDIQQGRRLVEVLKPAVKFVEALALERGVYNEALISGAQSADELNQKIAARLAQTDPLFRDAIAAADTLSPELSSLIAEPIRAAKSEIAAARSAAAPYLGSNSGNSAAHAQALIARYRAAGAEIDQALAATERRIAALDPALGLELEISRLSNDIGEHAGLRSTLLSRYAALHELSRDELAELQRQEGAIRDAWSRLQRTAEDVGGAKVTAAVALMKSEFFGKGDPIYEAAIEAATEGRPPLMELGPWRKWSVARLAESEAARDAGIAEIAEMLDTMQAKAVRNAAFGLAGVLGLLLALVLIERYMERRILRPIAILTQAIDPKAKAWEEPEVAAEMASEFAERDDEVGALARAVARMRDHAEDLEEANARFDALVDNLPHGVCLYDAKDFLIVANRRFGEIYGFPDVDALIGMRFSAIYELEELLQGGRTTSSEERLGAELENRAQPKGRIADHVVELANGRTLCINGRRVPGGGWISTHVDITEQRRAERQIAFIAEHDALTGLANRELFTRRLELAIQRAERGASFAVLCLDLDRFKLVNDMLGHGPGDELLRQAAQRLKESLRALDCVARVGGDEFSALLEDPKDRLAAICERIIARLSEPYDLDGQRAEISVSIGVAVGLTDGATAHELVRAADLAMYRAKNEGRGAFRFFEPEMDEQMRTRRALEHDMRSALTDKQFELEYQPIYNVEAGAIVAFEALMRWNHPRRGRISPAEFVPLAEDCGLIVEAGAWALRQACLEAMRWPKDIKVAVNLSPRQFNSGRLLADIVSALAQSGLPPWRLELEITERVMLANTETTLATLHEMRGLGISIALDDFGTGYSSLSYLRRFPFDRIKIDQTFVRDMTNDGHSMAIVRTVNGLARALSMHTTAEGVETQEQYASLRAEGCTELQGYFISRPVPAADVPRVIGWSEARAQVA
jgi:diguanylate cyclase (GGDEF)-like protein